MTAKHFCRDVKRLLLNNLSTGYALHSAYTIDNKLYFDTGHTMAVVANSLENTNIWLKSEISMETDSGILGVRFLEGTYVVDVVTEQVDVDTTEEQILLSNENNSKMLMASSNFQSSKYPEDRHVNIYIGLVTDREVYDFYIEYPECPEYQDPYNESVIAQIYGNMKE